MNSNIINNKKKKEEARKAVSKKLRSNNVKYFKKVFNENQFCENRIGGEDVYLSPENAAQLLDVSRKFIYELIQSKQLEAISVGRKLKRIKKRTLEEWLTNQAMKHER